MASRINFVVEGQTEERFVKSLLRDHFVHQSIIVETRLITTFRNRRKPHITNRGGLTTYRHAYDDIYRWIQNDESAICTTMFDLYRLPIDFPAFEEASRFPDPYKRVEVLENALSEAINYHRFIPYIQLHEFESLLFSDIAKLNTHYPEYSGEISQLSDKASEFKSPELINDGLETAPSKRIIKKIPPFNEGKAVVGPNVAAAIGLSRLQDRCQHFREWLQKLIDACNSS